jgi:PKD repeat protein
MNTRIFFGNCQTYCDFKNSVSAFHARRGFPIILYFSAALLSLSIFSQSVSADEECGTVVTPEVVALQQSLAGVLNGPEGPGGMQAVSHFDVPITFHVVRRTDGTGGLSDVRLNLALRDLNQQYEQVGMRFFRQRIGDEYYLHEIHSDNFYFNTNSSSMYNQLRQQGPVVNTVNIWFAPNTGLCGLSSFPNAGIQGTIMDNACSGVSGNNSTFPHELGHYFFLYHTHETAFGAECPDSSNCLTAGDLFCSTPADPRLSGLVQGNCAYSGNVGLPPGCTGGVYNPQTENLMSYSNKNCRDLFTQEQSDKMIWTLLNLRTNLFLYDSSDNDADGVLDVADNCPQIFNPAQIDTDFDGYGDICLHAQMDVDNVLGNVPHTANFIGGSDVAIISWNWDFGDGSFSTEQSPSHSYLDTGFYTVSLTASTADSTYVATMTQPIIVVADTVELASPLIGLGEDTVRIDIMARNSLPVRQFEVPLSWSGNFDLDFISVSTAGHRSSYFETAEAVSVDPINNRVAINLVTSSDGSAPFLAPGSGPIATIYFTVSGDPSGNTLQLTMQPYSIYELTYATDFGVYTPTAIPGSVVGEQFVCGDANGSGSVNIADVTFLIARIFSGGPGPVPNQAGDADGDGQVNIGDVTHLIARIFNGGPEPICS